MTIPIIGPEIAIVCPEFIIFSYMGDGMSSPVASSESGRATSTSDSKLGYHIIYVLFKTFYRIS